MNANVGMLHPVVATVATYTPGTSITYNAGKVIAEARAANISWNRSNDRFFGDDTELDTDNGVTGYSAELEATGLTDEIRGYILGETASTDEYTINNLSSPDVGFGYVRKMRLTDESTGVVGDSYEGWWYYKAKFGVTSEESRTKEENTEWRTPTLTGTGTGVKLSTAATLSFATHKTFSTLAAAIAYVNGKAGIT